MECGFATAALLEEADALPPFEAFDDGPEADLSSFLAASHCDAMLVAADEDDFAMDGMGRRDLPWNQPLPFPSEDDDDDDDEEGTDPDAFRNTSPETPTLQAHPFAAPRWPTAPAWRTLAAAAGPRHFAGSASDDTDAAMRSEGSNPSSPLAPSSAAPALPVGRRGTRGTLRAASTPASACAAVGTKPPAPAPAAAAVQPAMVDRKPLLAQLEAAVNAASARARESNLRFLTPDPNHLPDSLDKLSDQQLAMIDFKILLQLMSKAGLSSEQIAEVKSRRRRLKNRLSARLCSNKKREKCHDLEETNRDLLVTLQEVTEENEVLREENMQLKDTNASLSKASVDTAQENSMLRAQLAHLTQLLARTSLPAAPADDGAAFAA
jgi:hypothetical protein